MFVEVEGASIWCVDEGPRDALPIVAVGGWIGSSELWTWPLAALSDRWRTIAFDHRGTGATICDPASITHDRLVDDVFAVMDAHGLERAVLVGESAGTTVVVRAAAQYPQRVAGLVLVDATLGVLPPEPSDRFLAGLRADYPATIESFIQACVPGPGRESIREWGRRILARTTPAHAIALRRATFETEPVLPTVPAPALVIHVEGDHIAPIAGGRRIAELLPRADLVVLPGDEHVPTMTQPDVIGGVIAGWLGLLEAGARAS
jgi:pimeloyl-ACP methyl ester carboxylesterase